MLQKRVINKINYLLSTEGNYLIKEFIRRKKILFIHLLLIKHLSLQINLCLQMYA